MTFEKSQGVIDAEKKTFDDITNRLTNENRAEIEATLEEMKLSDYELRFTAMVVEYLSRLMGDSLNTIEAVAPETDRVKMANAIIYLFANIGKIGNASITEFKANAN